MKTRASVLLLLFVSACALSSAAFSTGNPAPAASFKKAAPKVDNVFRSFFLHRQHNDDIVLNWTVTSSNIASYVIQKSYDGEYFDNIDIEINTVGKWTRATDKDVFPGYIYYKVIAIMNDGTEVSSAVQVVRIVKRH